MQIVWRTLPKLALPAAIGLGIAYLATSFVPRPAPFLRPPEELRAQGQAYGEESPVRIILERNVLKLESPLFYPLGQQPAPIAPPPAVTPAPAPAQAAFAQADTSVTPQGAAGLQVSATAPLSGGSSVQGLVAPPGAAAPRPVDFAVSSATSPPAAPAASNTAAAPLAAQTQAATTAVRVPAAPAAAPKPQPAAQAPAPAAGPRAPAVQAAPRLGLEGFRLVGVIAGGARPLAMLQVDGVSVSLRTGEQARGWTLVSVEPGQVLLKNGEQMRRLELGGPVPPQRAKAP